MKALLLAGLMVTPCVAAHVPEGPWDTWELTVESGYLWEAGHLTEIDYEIIPTQLTLRSPVIFTPWHDEKGARIVVRNRFSALFESITAGPESYYIGFNGAPSIEYWFPSAKDSIFFSIGGGFGFTDSAGGDKAKGFDREALGQDFIFNWFMQLGVRHEIAENLSLLGGLYFLHHSDRGMTDPNPGIDALGFTVGCGWRF